MDAPAASVEQDLSAALQSLERFTVNQLKGILRELGVKCSGVKKDLQQRLRDLIDGSLGWRHDTIGVELQRTLDARTKAVLALIAREAGGGGLRAAALQVRSDPYAGYAVGGAQASHGQSASRPARLPDGTTTVFSEAFWHVERSLACVEFDAAGGSGQGRSARRSAVNFSLTEAEAQQLRDAAAAPVAVADDAAQASSARATWPDTPDAEFDAGVAAAQRLGASRTAEPWAPVVPTTPLKCVAWAFRIDAKDRKANDPFENTWPLGTSLRVNGMCTQLKRQRKIYAMSEGHEKAKGFSEPCELSRNCVGGPNRVEALSRCEVIEPYYAAAVRAAGHERRDASKPLSGLDFAKDELLDARFGFCVQLVRDISVKEIALRVARNATNPSLGEASQRAKAFASDHGGDDEEVCCSAAAFSLKCPISLAHIRVPARGRDCNHLQCFDLETHLALNVRHQHGRWRCTVCSRNCPPTALVVDAFVMKLISDFDALGESPDAVEINSDGSYKAVHTRKNGRGGGGGGGNGSSDDDDDAERHGERPPTRSPLATYAAPAPAPPPMNDVIDLCDDDDVFLDLGRAAAPPPPPAARGQKRPRGNFVDHIPAEDDWWAPFL
ncbi:hypothetical protein M885DRAFT_77538 [Pelagophyceae sp. CCMP2097]|nr:hypothetical protein M885DRAFT_77538 [Pelagophyceae sp. CCMP2097]